MLTDIHSYGQPTYWTWQIRQIAEKNGESCSCWDKHHPAIEILPHDNVTIRIKCISIDRLCNKKFPHTERDIKHKFYRFYT